MITEYLLALIVYGSGITTVPQTYKTKEACTIAGNEFIQWRSTHYFSCIPIETVKIM